MFGFYLRRVILLLQAERAKDRFLAIISHELRTPLTSILGYLEILVEGGEEAVPSEGNRRFLEIMYRNARRLLRLVGDVMFVTQMSAGEAQFEHAEVDLAAVAQESIAVFAQRAAQQGVELNADIAEIGKACVGDRGRLGQAIDNLISNAIKFTPEGGTVTVRLRPDGPDRAVIEVADTGIGVPQAEQKRLFEDFYRASAANRDAFQGTGLGLGIVKTIVTAHEGEIEFESEEGVGTTVRITLPLGRPAAPETAAAG